ncbi:hypothetical protein ACJX0J_028611, partial [Zea mays]
PNWIRMHPYNHFFWDPREEKLVTHAKVGEKRKRSTKEKSPWIEYLADLEKLRLLKIEDAENKAIINKEAFQGGVPCCDVVLHEYAQGQIFDEGSFKLLWIYDNLGFSLLLEDIFINS